jgi:hypothetical protein
MVRMGCVRGAGRPIAYLMEQIDKVIAEVGGDDEFKAQMAEIHDEYLRRCQEKGVQP